jgi:nucleoside-diphosphate-sugar epimerase
MLQFLMNASEKNHVAGETGKFTAYGRMGYVHIDDVASCHILAYEAAGAQGRYICNAAVLGCGDLAALLARRFPAYPVPRSLPSIYGEQSYGYDTAKARALGLREFKGVEEMFDDAVESLVGHGHLPAESASTSSLL